MEFDRSNERNVVEPLHHHQVYANGSAGAQTQATITDTTRYQILTHPLDNNNLQQHHHQAPATSWMVGGLGANTGDVPRNVVHQGGEFGQNPGSVVYLNCFNPEQQQQQQQHQLVVAGSGQSEWRGMEWGHLVAVLIRTLTFRYKCGTK